MNTTNNTVLITGGSAGIGLETAKILAAAGNKIIITGRDRRRMDNALAQLPGVTGIISDVSKNEDIDALVATVKEDFPALIVLINNAGRAFVYDLAANAGAAEKAGEELQTNFLSVVRLTEKLLPLFSAQKEAAVVNVSSIVTIVPGNRLPTYSASKAALHSYTQSLRISLSRAGHIKVFELMPPLVDTELSAEIGGHNGIPPAAVAKDLLNALSNDTYEIHVGNTKDMYQLYLKSPAEALNVMNPVLS